MSVNTKALFLDMDGVLWRDLQAIGDLRANIDQAIQKGFQLAFITNNATRTPDHYVDIFKDFDITIKLHQIYTSAETCAQSLSNRWPAGGNVFIIGEAGLVKALKRHNFSHSAQDALAVVVGLDRQLDYQKLMQATLLIRQGLPFYGTNPDRTLPVPSGQAPGAGAILAFLEASTGVSAIIIGKPNANMLLAAADSIGLSPAQAIMVGDRLETDIAAGQNAGCQTALVLSGASTAADLESWPNPPDYVANDFASLLEIL